MIEKEIVTDDTKREIILDNISYIMSVNNISNPTSLAKRIGIAPTTWYSFLKNPISNSNAKTNFCNEFGITVYQLENEKLSETEYSFWDSNVDIGLSDKPLISYTDDDIFISLNRSKCNDDKLKSEITQIKTCISEQMHLEYKSYIFKSRQEYRKGNYSLAHEHMRNAYWIMTPKDLNVLSENDIKCYAELCKRKNASSDINQLIEKLTLDEFYNNRIILIIATILEALFPEQAKLCYELVQNNLTS